MINYNLVFHEFNQLYFLNYLTLELSNDFY